MYLYKEIIVSVEGFEGEETEYQNFLLSNKPEIPNEDVITQEDVQEADTPHLEYSRYENLGEITNEEIAVLKKFKIV